MAARQRLRIEKVGIMSCVAAANVACGSDISCRSLRSRAEMVGCPGGQARATGGLETPDELCGIAACCRMLPDCGGEALAALMLAH